MKAPFYIICLVTSFCFSQNKQLLYGFNNVPQSILLNPAEQLENDWFVGVPLLSHIHLQIGASGVTPYDLFKEDGVDFNTKISNVLYQMDEKDFFVANQQLDIFSAGFAFGGFEKNKYLSFGMYQEIDAIGYYPKDAVLLAYEGNANSLNRTYNFSHISGSAELLSVFHVGFSKKVNKKLSYGIRGKIYSAIANINAVNNSGSFTTVQGNNNIYNQQISLNLGANTSGIAALINDDDRSIEKSISSFRKRLFFGGNFGFGIDLGITYNFKKQWQVAASVNDIGFIKHTKDVESYAVNGNYNFEGLEVLFPNNNTTQTTQDNWNEINNAFDDVFTVDTTKTAYTTFRPVKFNSAISYKFKANTTEECNCNDNNNEYTDKLGLQLFAVKRPKHVQAALTAFYQKQLFNGLNVKATYTLDNFSYNNVGLGLTANIFGFNMYFMADNLMKLNNLAKAQSASLQLGFNYIFKSNYKK